jgi:molecular chaperone Hsp33
LRGLFVELRAPGHLRGYPRAPDATIWAGDPRARRIGRALLPGILHVLRQVPDGNYAQGQVELVSGEIDEDLEAYFQRSEQVPTKLRTVITLDDKEPVSCSGVLVQTLPGGDEARLQSINVDNIAPDMSPEHLLGRVLGEGFNVLEIVPLKFACPCTRERALSGIRLLDDDQIIDMIHKDKGAEVRCDFCGELYNFDRDELTQLLDRKA